MRIFALILWMSLSVSASASMLIKSQIVADCPCGESCECAPGECPSCPTVGTVTYADWQYVQAPCRGGNCRKPTLTYRTTEAPGTAQGPFRVSAQVSRPARGLETRAVAVPVAVSGGCPSCLGGFTYTPYTPALPYVVEGRRGVRGDEGWYSRPRREGGFHPLRAIGRAIFGRCH